MIVSFFKSVKDPNTPFNRDIGKVLARIKDGNSKALIEQLRVMPAEAYNKAKTALPGVCFAGKFKTRSAAGLIQHSGLIPLDFDKFDTTEDALKLKDKLTKNPYIFAVWLSPSAKGLKALVKIPPIVANHKGYFDALEKHFDHPNWDESGKDVSRFCFESYDPDLYVNHDSEIWSELEQPEVEDVGTTEPLIAVESSNIIVGNLLKWWLAKYGMTKGSKNNNLFKLAKGFFDFGISESEALQECLKFDEGGKEVEITKIVRSAYKSGTPGTKFFEDLDKRAKIEKAIRAGKSKEELKQEFPKIDINQFKEDMFIDEFWYYNDKGRLFLSNHKFKFYLEQNNFFKFYPSDTSATFTFIKKDQNLLEETNDKRIKDYVLNDILSRPDIGYGPYDFMSGNTAYFKQDFLSMLSTTSITMKQDTASDGFLYYKNCVVKVTKDGLQLQDYIDIDGYVWKRQIIDREFKQADHHAAVFRKFVWLISGQDKHKYNTFKSVIGYLLHSFKTSANNKAIIFNDGTISDNPNGGSGKGLFWNALKQMKKVSRIDGKKFDPKNNFSMQVASVDTQILVYDDVKRNFNFEDLFSQITEGIQIEYKGQTAIQIPVEQSPKIIITTNYTISGTGGSFDRRKFEVEMSSHFNSKHTPLDEFKHMLFSDWNDEEWLRFDNYMVECLVYYLQHGLVQHEFDNLDVRKFHKTTSQDFDEWTREEGVIQFGVRMDKEQLFAAFLKDNKDYVAWLKMKRFTGWLVALAEYRGWTQTQGRSHSMRWIEFKKDGTTPETPKTEDKDGDDDIPF